MSSRQVGTPILIPLLVAVVAVGLALVPVTAPASASGACSRTPTYKVSVDSRASWYRLDTHRTRGGVIDQSKRYFRKNVDAGTTKLVFDMCKAASSGKWKVQRMLVRAPHEDLEITKQGREITSIKPVDGNNVGFAVFFRKRSAAKVTLEADRCTKKPHAVGWDGYSALKALLNVPWKVPHPVAIGAWVVGQALPDAPEDTYWCARMGKTLKLPITFRSKDGKPVVHWRRGHLLGDVHTKQTEYPCGGNTYIYCSWSEWQTLRVGPA